MSQDYLGTVLRMLSRCEVWKSEAGRKHSQGYEGTAGQTACSAH